MKKYKNPILLHEYLAKAKSQEARQELETIEKQYQTERRALDDKLFEQDKNFRMGWDVGYHSEKQANDYINYKDDQRMRLEDKFLSRGEETYNHYHPEEAQQAIEQDNEIQQITEETAQKVNDAYLLEQNEPELSEQLRETMQELSQNEEVAQDFMHGQELSLEEKELSKNEMVEELEQELTMENEESLEMEDEADNEESKTKETDISPDIDDDDI